MAVLIDHQTIDHLHHLLSQHGEVQSLTNLPGGSEEPQASMVLATMASEETAKLINQVYGFPVFGFNSVIITQDWLSRHYRLSSDDTRP